MDSLPARPSRRLRVILGAVGFVLSLLLLWVHYRTFTAPTDDSFCTAGAAFDCTRVAASQYSVFLGVPWALWGVIGFGTIWLAALQNSIYFLFLSLAAGVGSVALFLIEVLVIGSVCLLCEGIHLVGIALAILAINERASLKRDALSTVRIQSFVVIPAALLLALALFMPRYWGAFSYKAPPPFPTGVTSDGYPWIGAAEPKLTIHEFTDYQCPHCKIASALTLRRLARQDDLRIVRRQNPRMHCRDDSACQGVRLAYCAEAQGKFWQADRWLFEHTAPRKELDPQAFVDDLELNGEALQRCFHDPQIQERANAEAVWAIKNRLLETPGYLVDGKKLKPSQVAELF